jgi:hypothetical protein
MADRHHEIERDAAIEVEYSDVPSHDHLQQLVMSTVRHDERTRRQRLDAPPRAFAMNQVHRFALTLAFASGCGPGSSDTEHGDPDPLADLAGAEANDSQEDPWNCGELGAICVGPLGIGECVDGQCGATLAQCATPPGDCNSMCALDGRPCAELACDGATAWVWNASEQYEAEVLCALGYEQAATPLSVACDEPLDDLAMAALCCCSWG